MIKNKTFINESRLGRLIQANLTGTNIVNLKDDCFEYCNGHLFVTCSYNLDLVIQKLFKTGAISNYKNWTPERSNDFKGTFDCKSEIEATQTPYLKKLKSTGELANIFQIGNKFVSYQKRYIDIFENVQYKVSDEGALPSLRVYADEKLIGFIAAVRDQYDLLTEIIGS